MRAHSMKNSKQILHGEEKILHRRQRMLKPDLFVVANRLVFIWICKTGSIYTETYITYFTDLFTQSDIRNCVCTELYILAWDVRGVS